MRLVVWREREAASRGEAQCVSNWDRKLREQPVGSGNVQDRLVAIDERASFAKECHSFWSSACCCPQPGERHCGAQIEQVHAALTAEPSPDRHFVPGISGSAQRQQHVAALPMQIALIPKLAG